MQLNRWNRIIAGAFLIGGVAVTGFNYLVDPYEVFGNHFLRSGFSVNERYRKVEHLIQDTTPHDAYILGSSVMGVYDPATASRLSGHHYYNLSFMAGTPSDALAAVRTLKTHGKPIKEVIIGLDFYSFYEHPGNPDLAMRPHPLVSGESAASFWVAYLFASGIWQGATRIGHHLQAQPSIFYDVDHSGMYHLYELDQRIANDPEQYIKDKFAPKALRGVDVEWIDDRLKEFAELCRWLAENNIQAHIFVHPFYHETQAAISRRSYAELMVRLRKIYPGLVDFSAARITQDPHWYYDKRHYRPAVAEQIMMQLYSGTGPSTKIEESEQIGKYRPATTHRQ